MIYAIVGTHTGLRGKGSKEFATLGVPTHHMYSEHIGSLEALIDATSLFGDTVVVWCIQLGEVASSKEEMMRLLERMSSSPNTFVIDEPFADVHLFNRLKKVAKKIIDAREEKIKDVSVFTFCESFIMRNKKQAWIDFTNINTKDNGEAIQGALWWKFQMEWQKVREGKRSLFSEEDCERIGGDIMRSSILAHRGQKDLVLELERIILTI